MTTWKQDFVSIDTETTGFRFDAKVVDFAAIRFIEGAAAIDTSFLIDPLDIDWKSKEVDQAMSINGLTKQQLTGQPSFADVAEGVLAALKTSEVLVAHNAAFDVRMLLQEFYRVYGRGGQEVFGGAVLDTIKLDCWLRPQAGLSRKLVDVAKAWGVPYAFAHRAKPDAMACGQVLVAMLDRLPDELEEVMAGQNQAKWRR